jgi:hypothetical protein
MFPQNEVFVRCESRIQSYARSFPAIFARARGTELWDVQGRRYLDFLAGAGSLNYGHNNPVFKKALIEYVESDGLTHSLDLHTVAKEKFLQAMHQIILEPRGLDHVVQFTGPTGTNAVEAALKLARKVTGRSNATSSSSPTASTASRWGRWRSPATNTSVGPAASRCRARRRCPTTATSKAWTPSPTSTACWPTGPAASICPRR